jgi:hypothetical protein
MMHCPWWIDALIALGIIFGLLIWSMCVVASEADRQADDEYSEWEP